MLAKYGRSGVTPNKLDYVAHWRSFGVCLGIHLATHLATHLGSHTLLFDTFASPW